ncbi:MAG: dienelactone hydrolase family protein [Caldilineaceae bacterium]|nr:dienelactone hydrolase family protein [Caldilineaceae bacterium]
MTTTIHQGQPIYTTGKPLAEAKGALILIHGRGATAQSILTLAQPLAHPELAYLAPQAAGNTWYPYSFLMPLAQNEPYLSSALQQVGAVLEQVTAAGIPPEQVILGGFSQGACLAAEFVARNAQRYGGLLVFSGGLIGPPQTPRTYAGSLADTPVFLGCSDIDAHIPKERVIESAAVFRQLGAQVTDKLYPNLGHTIIDDEIDHARQIIDNLLG